MYIAATWEPLRRAVAALHQPPLQRPNQPVAPAAAPVAAAAAAAPAGGAGGAAADGNAHAEGPIAAAVDEAQQPRVNQR